MWCCYDSLPISSSIRDDSAHPHLSAPRTSLALLQPSILADGGGLAGVVIVVCCSCCPCWCIVAANDITVPLFLSLSTSILIFRFCMLLQFYFGTTFLSAICLSYHSRPQQLRYCSQQVHSPDSKDVTREGSFFLTNSNIDSLLGEPCLQGIWRWMQARDTRNMSACFQEHAPTSWLSRRGLTML